MSVPPLTVHRRVHRSRLARFAKSLARGMIDRAVERRLSIDCTSPGEVWAEGQLGDSLYYSACDYPFLLKCLNILDLKNDDVAFEIGCGLGRALCLMARRGVKKCVGIELSPELAARAQANIQSMRSHKAPTEVLAVDAATADYSEGTAFYLFNPFGAATLKAVLDRIHESLKVNPRKIRIIYLNPFLDEVLESSGWLRRVRNVRSIWSKTYASYWESTAS